MAQEGPKSALIGPQEGPGSQPKDNKGGGAVQYQSQFSAWSELERVVNLTSSLSSSYSSPTSSPSSILVLSHLTIIPRIIKEEVQFKTCASSAPGLNWSGS